MRQSLLLAAAIMAGPSAAQVVTMHLPAFGALKPVGSVISSEKDKTTFSITCGSGTPATAFCPFGQNFRITSAPSTIIFTQTAPLDESMISSLGSASE
ncbi:hypothetical protein MAPG_00995 [Magnaporthiopsis poae ATCC 64411]|uniref:Uncharacterized protein n=1 Tax=Magnaporthiopsis poae (strain ATCC 64411 / 73-15) TaxID=644358 RepID=A0A0C4DMI6_MAGP6|nr:hypothetical protein MAPG_00995 [Magnaporthiopsis poae ATCC 64411]